MNKTRYSRFFKNKDNSDETKLDPARKALKKYKIQLKIPRGKI